MYGQVVGPLANLSFRYLQGPALKGISQKRMGYGELDGVRVLYKRLVKARDGLIQCAVDELKPL